MGVCMCGFCDVWVCVCVGFVMCGCVYVWVCNVWEEKFCDRRHPYRIIIVIIIIIIMNH